jgi:hypothetical protein
MSGPRTTIYAFGLTVLALFAFYVDAEAKEIALWQAALGASIPAGALVLTTVKTWPRKSKENSTDV